MVPHLVKLLKDLEGENKRGEADARGAYERTLRDIRYLAKRDLQAADTLRRLVAKDADEVREKLEGEIAGFRDELESTADSELRRAKSYVSSLPRRPEADKGTESSAVPQKVPGATGPGLIECTHERRIEMAAEIAETDPTVTFETLRPVGDELWFLIDGKRTLGDIRDAICYEFEVNIPQVYIDELVGQLVDGGRVTLRE